MMGWLNRSSTKNNGEETDPYGDITVANGDKKAFAPSFFMKLYHAFALFALPFASIVFISIISDGDYWGAVYVLLWMSLVYFGILRVVPKKIIADARSVNLEFWLRKALSIPWNSIGSLKIRKGRGTFAISDTDLGKFYLPVEAGGFLESREMVKMVIQRSPLTFKRGNSFRNAFYERV